MKDDMSIIMDDTSQQLSRRILSSRKAQGWSLADLATRSGVSKAMLSKIERCEVSPTASVLMRIASAFNITLAELLTDASAEARFQPKAEQAVWTDPASDYVRRQIYMTSRLPLELVEVVMPPETSVAIPAASYAFIRQVTWVIEGALTIVEGATETKLETGDRLEFGPPADCAFRNEGKVPCRYLVAVLRQR